MEVCSTVFFSHFEIFFPLQCSITLTLFWDFFYKEYFVVAATKYMCIADLVKSKNEFPQRCNKKAVLFSHSAWFCLFIIIFSLHQNIYVLLLPGNNFQCTYFALQKCNNSNLRQICGNSLFFSFFFEKNSWNAKVNQFHEFFALNLIVKFWYTLRGHS